ncbi:MAG: two-component regulator propeller domain-containing protein, partial [Bacteroidia bacterium]
NLSDIKRSNILSQKQINRINVIGNFAYVSTGFGIVVIDVAKREVKDTYKIGPNGADLEIFEVAINANTIMAATKDGMYMADINNPFLVNFNNWTRDTTILPGKYNTVTAFDNKFFANRNRFPENGQMDIIYYYDGGGWQILDTINTFFVYRLKSTPARMVSVNAFSVSGYDANLDRVDYVFSQDPAKDAYRDAVIDTDNNYWMADNNLGLARYIGNNTVVHIAPNGPATNNVFSIKSSNGDLWVASGGRNLSAGPLFLSEGVYHYSDHTWTSYTGGNTVVDLDTIFDPVEIAIDPSDSKHVFVGSWGRGLVEIKDGQNIAYYTEANSSLKAISGTDVRVGGVAFDSNNNLWVNNALVDRPLSVKKTDGTWQSFAFPGVLTPTFSQTAQMVIDDSDQKWVIMAQNIGLFVFNDNGTISNTSDDQYRLYSTSVGNGNLPSASVHSLALDREGELWIGTDKGIAVIYSPGSVFSGNNYDAQQILIQQDGYNQYLLETETVTAIAVDGANRKWFGTGKAGVFLMSADGTKQLQHFDMDNSPLPSNHILSIAINNKTGEIFFGTIEGIVSYRGTATEPLSSCQDLYAFPNPVKENYNGIVAISGVIGNGNIKITDVAGNVVHQARAEGSQAIWNARKLDGERVKTGVYLVFSTNEDGTETCTTKILVVN